MLFRVIYVAVTAVRLCCVSVFLCFCCCFCVFVVVVVVDSACVCAAEVFGWH